MRVVLVVLSLVLAFATGLFIEHDYNVVNLSKDTVAVVGNNHLCKCVYRDNVCTCKDNCDCCSACPGQGSTSKCKCKPKCGCCHDCPGHKDKK